MEESERFDITREADLYADSLLTSLTLEQRIGQCLMPALNALDNEATIHLYKKYIEDYHIGGIVLLKGNLQGAKLFAEIGRESKVPLFIAIDAEWGLGMRLEDAPIYPKNGQFSSQTEDSVLYDYGNRIAQDCREAGINMVLGPVIDISTAEGNIIGQRSFGSDPQRVSELGIAYAKGLESGNVISVAKHFPGHGSSFNDSHKETAVIPNGISVMDSLELKPFRDYVNTGLSGVMAGHIQSFALDPDGKPASVSMDILTYLLRDEMGFKGLILTDAFDMGGIKGYTAADAIKAGADIVLCPSDLSKEFNDILQKIRTGYLPLDIINERCHRILFQKYLIHIDG